MSASSALDKIHRPPLSGHSIRTILTYLIECGCEDDKLVKQFQLLSAKIELDIPVGSGSYVAPQDRKNRSITQKLTDAGNNVINVKDAKESELAEIEQYEKSGMFDAETIAFMKAEIEQKYSTQSPPSTLDL